MQKFVGMGVSRGRVIGPAFRMPPAVTEPEPGERWDRTQTSVEDEQARLKAAARDVQSELQSRADSAEGDAKALLETTALMAADPMLLQSANGEIVAGISAERAVWEAGSQVADMLRGLGGYMAERTTDVLDVRSRIVAALRGQPAPGIPSPGRAFILVAEDLAPADTASLDPAVVVGLVTASGGPQSHTATLASDAGIPTVVGALGAEHIMDGTEVYVDGASGEVITDPDETHRTSTALWRQQSSSWGDFDGRGRTLDGHEVPLMANIGSAAAARKAAAARAEGVGLLRTEFCFLGRDSEPSVDDQASLYTEIFQHFPNRKVVVRTLDAGADKPLAFLSSTGERNPALGNRGYRAYKDAPGVLDRQLEAIARAAAETAAEVWVMAPMIATANESAAFAQLCHDAGLQTTGVMVEIPAAALTAEAILQEVDFVSLGTNDLTQYTMAADRELGSLGALNDPWQPALLRLVSLTVEGARAARKHDVDSSSALKPVGVCGEAAADAALAVVLVGLGVDTLSMSVGALPAVAVVLKSVDLQTAQELASLALHAANPLEGRQLVRERLPILHSLGL